MELTVQHLRCFIAVAEELNLTRAAARLHLSPSTVSEQVALIERRVGRPLFVRTSRSVTATAAAAELLPLARRVVADMDDVTAWAAGPDASSAVVIGVMAPSRRFRSLVAEARALTPDVAWTIRQLPFAPPYDALTRRDLDVAVLGELGPVLEVPGIATVELWEERLVLMAAEDHPLVERRTARLADLAGERLICGPRGRENQQWFAHIIDLIPGVPTVLTTAHNVEETAEMCAAGIGVTVAAEAAIEMFDRPGLAFVPLTDAPTATIRMHVRRGDPSRTVASLVELARVHSLGQG